MSALGSSDAGREFRAVGFARGLPALLYHKIDRFKMGVRHRGLYVSPRIFRAQMAELRRGGFRPVAATELDANPGERRVVITFDDGFANVLEFGLPALHEFGLCGINFLVSGHLGGWNAWDVADGERPEPLMDEAQVRDWLAAGQEIGAHSVSHAHLTRLSAAAAREEIAASKKTLEDRFSREVADFAYPYGEFSVAIRELVAEAGFARAWTVVPAAIERGVDRLALPRFPVVVSLRNALNLLRSLLPSQRRTPP